MVRVMCGVHLRGRKRAKDLMLMMSLKETVDGKWQWQTDR